ncbi:putative PurR-regulated permease PerM [Humibacillus xanthopallidus]|uniref:Putative PurR-regulated permease PerM n=1 Tax=Humibacillus xanthopallidus TaxID=412689 RepID=A0A543PPP3_9MICO|nr:AI-2E family transporter [Humibacillus xanthopallidus]TQN46051.1 putative PurR-regulated permease PerM [Humibacillus xanthopallidus]
MSANPAALRARREPNPLLPRGFLIIVGMAAAFVLIVGLNRLSSIIAPTFLALVLTITVAPIRTYLVGRGLPVWVGALAAILTVTVGVVAFVALLVVSVARFAAIVPQYADQATALTNDVKQWLTSLGVTPEQAQTMLSSLNLGKVVSFLGGLLGGLLSSLTSIAFILTLVLFTCMDSSSFTTSLDRLRHERPGFVAAMSGFTHGTRRYLLVSTIFGLAVAIIDTLLLWALGVPAPVLWGLLAFITNYIPNIGFLIGLVPPTILALLEGGPSLALTVIVLYSVVNLVIQSVIQPKLVGDAVGLSATLTFLSLIVWAGILGPIGAIMAVPLTLLVKAVLVDVDPQSLWVGALLGDQRDHTVHAPHTIVDEPSGPSASATGASDEATGPSAQPADDGAGHTAPEATEQPAGGRAVSAGGATA